MWAVSNKWGCLPIGPKWTNFAFLYTFLYKINNQLGVYFMEKIDIFCIEGPLWQVIMVKRMPADWPNMGPSNFFIILNLK